jgi:hypothetical protein
MSRSTQRLLPVASLAVLMAAAALPAVAASSASSESVGSSSTSVGSLSNSVGKSSDSSSGKDKDVAEGDYRVIEVAAAADQPGKLRVKLQAAADDSPDGELYLTLPPTAVARGQLASGAVVSAKQRAYGVEFAAGAGASATREPFFLVLRDDWFRELDSKPVVL